MELCSVCVSVRVRVTVRIRVTVRVRVARGDDCPMYLFDSNP